MASDAAEGRSLLSRLATKVFAKASPSDIRDILGDTQIAVAAAEVAKSSEHLSEGDWVHDQWDREKPKTATREETTSGPAQGADGGNAEKMIRQYSDVAPQIESQRAVEKLARNFAAINAVVKSHAETLETYKGALIQMTNLVEALGGQVTAFAKSMEAKREEKKETEEEKEDMGKSAVAAVAASLVERGNAKFAVAKSLADKAEALAKSGKADSAKVLRADARSLAAEALPFFKSAFEVAASDEVGALMKSAEELSKAEDEAEKVEVKVEEKEKETAKGAVDPNLLQDALRGVAVLQKSVADLMETVRGGSAGAAVIDPAPAMALLAKSDPIGFASNMAVKIQEAEDHGILNADDAETARNIVSLQRRAASGEADEALVKARITAAPVAVRNFLQAA